MGGLFQHHFRGTSVCEVLDMSIASDNHLGLSQLAERTVLVTFALQLMIALTCSYTINRSLLFSIFWLCTESMESTFSSCCSICDPSWLQHQLMDGVIHISSCCVLWWLKTRWAFLCCHLRNAKAEQCWMETCCEGGLHWHWLCSIVICHTSWLYALAFKHLQFHSKAIIDSYGQ